MVWSVSSSRRIFNEVIRQGDAVVQRNPVTIQLAPWSECDLPLLERIMGDPVMMTYLGGPETLEQIAERQKRYERLTESGTGAMFAIVDVTSGEKVGSVGYWERATDSDVVYEMR